MGTTASCKPSKVNTCCTTTDIDIRVTHQTRAMNYNANYIAINTKRCTPRKQASPEPILAPQAMKMVLSMRSLPGVKGCSPNPPASHMHQMRQFPKYAPPTSLSDVESSINNAGIVYPVKNNLPFEYTEEEPEPEPFHEAISLAVDVMTPELPSRKHIIDKNRGTAEMVHDINAELLKQMSMVDTDESEGDDDDDDATVIYRDTGGITTEIKEIKTSSVHKKRSSNLIHPKEKWAKTEMDQLASEMRTHLVMLKRQSLSAQGSFQSIGVLSDEYVDDGDDYDDSQDSDSDNSDSCPKPLINDVMEIVSENIKLTEKFHLKIDENKQQSDIINAQQKQIDELHRMLQQLQTKEGV